MLERFGIIKKPHESAIKKTAETEKPHKRPPWNPPQPVGDVPEPFMIITPPAPRSPYVTPS